MQRNRLAVTLQAGFGRCNGLQALLPAGNLGGNIQFRLVLLRFVGLLCIGSLLHQCVVASRELTSRRTRRWPVFNWRRQAKLLGRHLSGAFLGAGSISACINLQGRPLRLDRLNSDGQCPTEIRIGRRRTCRCRAGRHRLELGWLWKYL